MGRIRTIKPEVAESESLGRVSRDARLLFILLWTIADDEGRLRGNPAYIAGALFPYDEDSRGFVEPSLQALADEGMIRRYVAEGNSYVQIVNWAVHQKIDRPTKSKIPPFEPETIRLAEDSSNTRRGIAEGSCADQDLDQDREREVTPPTPSRGKRQNFVPPTLEEVTAYMAELELPPDTPPRFFDYYQRQGWKLSNGVKMADWRATCRDWKRKHDDKKKKGDEPPPMRRPA